MESFLHSEEKEKFQTWMAVFGAICVLIFAFSPLPSISSSPGSAVYMTEGHGEQWPMIIFALSVAILVYFQVAYGALVTAIGFCVSLLSVIYQFYSGTYLPIRNIIMWGIFARAHSVTFSKFQIFALFVGSICLIASTVWVLWLEWETQWNGQPAKNAAAAPSRHFDPRSIDPLATTGFCYNCGTKNPLSRNQCLQCNVNLPWLAASAPAVSAKPVQRQKPKQDFFAMPSVSVDWTVLGIGIISFLVWPLGLVLFFAFSKTDEEKGNAAIIGACLALALFVLRFIYLMATAVH
jgi:hypothetical protein